MKTKGILKTVFFYQLIPIYNSSATNNYWSRRSRRYKIAVMIKTRIAVFNNGKHLLLNFFYDKITNKVPDKYDSVSNCFYGKHLDRIWLCPMRAII